MKIIITKLYGTPINIVKELNENKRSKMYWIDKCYIDEYGRLHYMYADPNRTEYKIFKEDKNGII